MPSTGTLVVRVFTSRTQLPISNATVTVLQKSETNKLHLLAIRVTDRNGKTEPITIETPDLSESFIPGEPHAYTKCDIWAEHPDYQLSEIQNVEIFPGIESLLEISLIPLLRSQSNLRSSIRWKFHHKF